ncbi:hypothetical protein A3C23_03340 [Candidatus Roizmanbacteria bacterium RIFCSPHIGHO2_02_FULL_37_13b]|uniref:Uncharacterized protein n=1 Tax=Candidatus Roizmanbacteria bacterium RIFCSPLOWO2_02_FULL_36_11 TaxID=1802071 RepID=A0A1F7JGG7_9BACT|nr:MAG: hypothetical protein A3C23_03340 [Candidatus Roizmanbacteria bacterium RIFCSPHIGHO2_02_FULL_37_13b]OGK54709.1 MAG: hypothetical protein A3H78_05440 [Candidatus Roizmanbacteria bacterium RIFCSPLOWO2_02_FULL_36_11]
MKKTIKAIIFDIDGVLILGSKPIPGATKTIQLLQKNKFPFVMLTNTTLLSRENMAKKINRTLSVKVDKNDILTASSLTGDYLRQRTNNKSLILVEKSAMSEFDGIERNDDHPDFVVLGDFGNEINLDVLNKALRCLYKGAKLIAMQNDPYDLTEKGPILNVGSWTALFEKASGKSAIIIGKPSVNAFKLACAKFNINKKNIAVIGDSIEKEILPAKKLGLISILVKTGVSNFEKKTTKEADYIIDSIAELPNLIRF